MKHRRTLFPLVAIAASFALILPSAFSFQDPLNRGRGGGTSQGQRQNPPKTDPPRQNPPRQDPGQRNIPPRQDPPKREIPPPRQDPPRREIPPPRQDPPKREFPPPRQDPPKREDPGQRRLPPKEDPPKREDIPRRREDPPKREDPGQRRLPPKEDPPKREDIPRRREDPPQRQDTPIFRSGGSTIGRSNGGSQGSTGQGRTGMEELLRRKSGSRSGSVKYDSNSNRTSRIKGPISIDRLPSNFQKGGTIGGLVRRADEIRVGGVRIRFGYNHYDSRWCDDYFYYPHYVFDPYTYNNWAFSPWYYYPHLPPYFDSRRCYFPTTYLWTPFYGVRYTWRQPSREYWNRDYSELDYVIEDIVNAFQDGDRRAVDRLTPQRGSVAIVTDGRFAYQLRPDDFYDTFLDAVENTRTLNYRILDVQYRRDAASIFAQHDFEDPWGRRTSVYHYYKVEVEGRNWVIREFGTSYNRW